MNDKTILEFSHSELIVLHQALCKAITSTQELLVSEHNTYKKDLYEFDLNEFCNLKDKIKNAM